MRSDLLVVPSVCLTRLASRCCVSATFSSCVDISNYFQKEFTSEYDAPISRRINCYLSWLSKCICCVFLHCQRTVKRLYSLRTESFYLNLYSYQVLDWASLKGNQTCSDMSKHCRELKDENLCILFMAKIMKYEFLWILPFKKIHYFNSTVKTKN